MVTHLRSKVHQQCFVKPVLRGGQICSQCSERSFDKCPCISVNSVSVKTGITSHLKLLCDLLEEGIPGFFCYAVPTLQDRKVPSLFKLTYAKLEKEVISSPIKSLALEERLGFQIPRSTPCFAKGPFCVLAVVCKDFLTPNESPSSADFVCCV